MVVVVEQGCGAACAAGRPYAPPLSCLMGLRRPASTPQPGCLHGGPPHLSALHGGPPHLGASPALCSRPPMLGAQVTDGAARAGAIPGQQPAGGGRGAARAPGPVAARAGAGGAPRPARRRAALLPARAGARCSTHNISHQTAGVSGRLAPCLKPCFIRQLCQLRAMRDMRMGACGTSGAPCSAAAHIPICCLLCPGVVAPVIAGL